MLIEDFYTISAIKQVDDNNYQAFIRLNKEHAIFKGHFPGNPVTPGVCMVQILKELTAKITQKNLQMKRSNNIKFMTIINPETNPDLMLELQVNVHEEGVDVRNTCYFEDTIALKMNVKYIVL